jgi:hypothetical protein
MSINLTTRIDNSNNELIIDLSYKCITEMKWEGCPQHLHTINLNYNQIIT